MPTYMSDDTCISYFDSDCNCLDDNDSAEDILYPITTHLDVANVKAIDPP
jgi:hypothetical protein